MFQALRFQPDDALLGLIDLFRKDRRSGKIDLGVGTYRDEHGLTPVMQVVKQAERILLETQQTKGYLGPGGDADFINLLTPLIFGGAGAPDGRLAGVQTPGGGGALRLGAELIAAARPGATVWLGVPTWPNHHAIFAAVGLRVAEYRYFRPDTQSVCFDEMLDALARASAGDVVVLHGCCHNPTGAGLESSEWELLADVLEERGLVPLIDLAYQGFGAGLEADAYGTRVVLSRVSEALLAYSCDKNFGLYRERTGALYILAANAAEASMVRGNLLSLARVNWSMPPDHGAAVVRIVLGSETLARAWRAELGVMRDRINHVRRLLAEAEPSLAFLARQNGMFSTLPIGEGAVSWLRANYGIYMADSGRINLAGLSEADTAPFLHALRAVGARSCLEISRGLPAVMS